LSKRAAAFTQADIARAIRAAKQELGEDCVVEIRQPGGALIRIAPGGLSNAGEPPLDPNRKRSIL
jgi:hypothetical protein